MRLEHGVVFIKPVKAPASCCGSIRDSLQAFSNTSVCTNLQETSTKLRLILSLGTLVWVGQLVTLRVDLGIFRDGPVTCLAVLYKDGEGIGCVKSSCWFTAYSAPF